MNNENAIWVIDRWGGNPYQQVFDYSFENIFSAAKYWDESKDEVEHFIHFKTSLSGERLSKFLDIIPWASRSDIERAEAAIRKKLVKKDFAALLRVAITKAKQLASNYEEIQEAYGHKCDGFYLGMNWQMVWTAYFRMQDGIEKGKAEFQKDYGKMLNKAAWQIANDELSMKNMHPIFCLENIDKIKNLINTGYVNAKSDYLSKQVNAAQGGC